jgi:hypothetical protein
MKEPTMILSDRLPELTWKLNTLYPALHPKWFPPGLFIQKQDMTPQSCIDEINDDLQKINAQNNKRIALYLADRVNKKINVLVRLCQVRRDTRTTHKPIEFDVQAISTRQQWLGTLEKDIAQLSIQQQALAFALQQLKNKDAPEALLKLHAEIGEVERRLTLAKERLARAISLH